MALKNVLLFGSGFALVLYFNIASGVKQDFTAFGLFILIAESETK